MTPYIQDLLDSYYAWQKKIQIASTLWNVVANDQNNRMPPAAKHTRADQLAHLNGHIHDLSNDLTYTGIVGQLMQYINELSPKDKRSVQFAWGGIQYSRTIPSEFIERFDTAKSTSLAHRHEAKKVNDWSVLAPHLKVSFDLAKEYATVYNNQIDVFDVWCDYGEFTMTAEKYEALFEPISQVCNQVIQAKQGIPKDMQRCINDFDRTTLLFLLRELLSKIGFDFEQGVLGVIKRPYSENCGPHDERIHVGDDKPLLETILAAMHECGHGLTDMYINPEYHWTNLHRSLPMGIHESQARGLENIIGRSLPFCTYLSTLLHKYFPGLRDRDAQAIYDYLNHVAPSSIRTSADEATYNLHIIIRYKLEQEIFHGITAIAELPTRRNSLYQEYLGIIPDDHREGCLQDQHRSVGLFGYFPTYTLGNVIASQLRETFIQVYPHRETMIATGDFSGYFSRYHEQVWQHGNMETTHDMLLRVTGKGLTYEPFVTYMKTKYGV